MKILFLDDDEVRHRSMMPKLIGHDVVQAYSAEEAIKALEVSEAFDLVFLDHDLSNEHYASAVTGEVGELEGTGYDVAVFIAETLQRDRLPKAVVVHTMNPSGASRMMAALYPAPVISYRWVFDPRLRDISVFKL